jgi:hypothetical protein
MLNLIYIGRRYVTHNGPVIYTPDVRNILYIIMAKSLGFQEITVAQTLTKGCEDGNLILLA